MRVLVLGEGGREHALAWKISKSPRVEKVYWVKGNGAELDKVEKAVIGGSDQLDLFSKFIRGNEIDLVMVGPELPLAMGIADFLQEEGIKVFGPVKAAARLESDKGFAKEFMDKYNIPTAKFQKFTNYEDAVKAIINQNAYPVVMKATGLAAGKGVLIAENDSTARTFIEDVMVKKKFGEGHDLVIEEFLHGREISVFGVTDGYNIIGLKPVQDHKQLMDGGKGPNTGGMGAYSPVPFADEEFEKEVMKNIFIPTIDGLRDEGILYQGLLYAGLMVTDSGPMVLEYNCRFGDPETQILMRLLETDLVDILEKTVNGELDTLRLTWKPLSAVCVVLASGGYPGSYEKGLEITGLENLTDPDIEIFHAGTSRNKTKLETSGGRVLNVTGTGPDLETAREKVYNSISKINFKGMHYRKDIGLTPNK